MKRTQRVTQRDVAERAGVSTAVVSYVINNGPRPTSPEVRERVLRAIEELNYHPNGAARGLRARRTHTIAFVAHDFRPHESFGSHYLASILSAMTSRLKEQGYYLLMFPLAIGEDLTPLRALLHSSRLDGIALRLVEDPPQTDAILSLIEASGVPCVCLERPGADRFTFPTITYDDASGASAATRHLIEQGHRRIATIHGDLRYATARARLDGFKRAIKGAGLPLDADLVTGAEWGTKLASECTHRLLNLPDPPTAIFAASDDMAIGAVNAARNRGLDVPGDLAVVGFDDIPLAAETVPTISTIRIPLAAMGARAAELLLDPDGGAGSEDDLIELFPTELVRRMSS